MELETTAERLKTHVYTLAGDIGERNVFHPQALHTAADYIGQEWCQQGYTPQAQTYTVDPKGMPSTTQPIECSNLEITRTGSKGAQEMILIGAHYDSVIGSPGANDNGSGIAALLELSKLFAALTPKINVRFVAFVNEEPPFFMWNQMGSQVYAKAARKMGDKIRFMISLETIGYFREEPGSQHYPPLFKHFYPDRGNFIGFVSNLRLRAVMRCAVRAFRAHSEFPVEHLATLAMVPGVSWSDHLSFWRQGYRAFMITDTAFYRYPYYHTAQDTPEKLCYQPFCDVTNGLFRALLALAD